MFENHSLVRRAAEQSFRRFLWLVLLAGILVGVGRSQTPKREHVSWADYLGGSDSAQYSALTQINKANVKDLQLEMFLPAGGNNSEFGFNPVAVGNIMYLLGKNDAITAFDMLTRETIWSHEVATDLMIGRGINYWKSKDGSDRRLIYNSDNCIRELDALTGKEITSFGDKGCVDLRQDLGRDPKTVHLIQSFTPGRVFQDFLVVGSATGEDYGSPPGDIRAYNVRTGRLAWIFHTVPHPENGATKLGLPMLGPMSEERTSGASSRWMRNEAFCTPRRAPRPTTFMAQIARGRISFLIASSRWTCEQANICGTFSLCIMTSGTTTPQRLRSW